MKRFLLGALLLVFLLLAALAVYLDRILGAAIERGASYALGVETRVGFVQLRPLAGRFDVSGLRIANPPGFDEPHFLDVDGAGLAVSTASLREAVVVVPSFEIRGVDLALEKEGRDTNYGAILRNLKRFESQGEAPPQAPAGEGGGKRFIVQQLVISDVTAHVEWAQLAADQTALQVAVPRIELRDVGARNARGVALAELTSIVVKAVLTSVAQQGGSLPAAVLGPLRAGLGPLDQVSGLLVQGVGKGLGDTAGAVLGDEAGQAVRDAGGAAAESLGGAVGETTRRALGGLFRKREEPSE